MACAAALPSAWAAGASPRCGAGFDWNDFSTLDLTVRGPAATAAAALDMRVALTRYDDGQRLVVVADARRGEVVTIDTPGGRAVLASDAQAPFQLAEIDMVLEPPLRTLQMQFGDPCQLQPGVRYPLARRADWPDVSGEFVREGAAIRFVIRRTDERRPITTEGTVAYETAHRRLPAKLRIAGWTLFGASIRPEDGRPSAFTTLGEFEDSLKTNPTP